jgi:hypothetical protein
MRIQRIALAAALLLAAQLLTTSSGCITVPKLVDRTVQLVASGSVTVPFHAGSQPTGPGIINTFSDTKTIDIKSEVDLASVLSDAGLDVSDVKDVTLAGISYRVTKADPNAARKINGDVQVTVTAATNVATDLIKGFSANAGATTGWITPTLNKPGVDELNTLMKKILANLKGGAAVDEHLKYSIINGTSTPLNIASDFDYELRLTLNIVGTVKTKIVAGK